MMRPPEGKQEAATVSLTVAALCDGSEQELRPRGPALDASENTLLISGNTFSCVTRISVFCHCLDFLWLTLSFSCLNRSLDGRFTRSKQDGFLTGNRYLSHQVYCYY